MQGFFQRTIVVIPLLAGCGGGDDTEDPGPPGVDCEAVDVPTFAEVSAFDVCTNCHNSALTGPDRNGAPVGYNFDVYESAAAHASEMVTQVSGGFMPPPSSGFSITTAQKDELFAWAECGTPE